MKQISCSSGSASPESTGRPRHVRLAPRLSPRLLPEPHRMTSLDYYAIEDLLTDEERAARDRARRFVQEEVMHEVVPCHRAAKFPEHLTARMGALGFFAP